MTATKKQNTKNKKPKNKRPNKQSQNSFLPVIVLECLFIFFVV